MLVSDLEISDLGRQTKKCPYCNTTLDWSVGKGRVRPSSPSLDRVNNGMDISLDNAQVICYRCNFIKGNGSEIDLLFHAKALVRGLSILLKKRGLSGK